MGAVTTVPTFLDNLVTVLDALTALDGVAIYSGPVDDLSIGQEGIVFAVDALAVDYDMPTMGAVETFEEYEVEGRVWIVKPGAGETVIKTARDRAFALLEVVHDKLASYTDTASYVAALGVDKAAIAGFNLEQFAGDGYRDCRIAFTVRVRAHFTPA